MAYNASDTEKKDHPSFPVYDTDLPEGKSSCLQSGFCAYLRGRRAEKAFWQNISRKVVLYLVNPL